MYYHIYLYHGNKFNYHCVITWTLQNGQTLGQFFELLYLPWNKKLLILPIWVHMANKPWCIIKMPFKVQMLVIGRKLWMMKLTCSPNMALGNSNCYQKAERQSVAVGHTQSKLAQKVKSPDTKLGYVHRDTCRSLVLISMIHMHQLFVSTPFMPYSIWWHLTVGIKVKMMSLAHSWIVTEVIYMWQPKGYDDGTGHVMWLIHSLYGLKQAVHYWNKYMDRELTVKIDFSQIPSDAATYVHKHTNGNIIILAIHVDNVMGFKLIKDRDLHTITINHSCYIDAILCRFNMAECDPVDTPMVPNKTLSKFDCPTNDNKKQVMSTWPYQELIGALIWLSITSCQDISFMATHLAKFNSNPGYTHWTATKCILHYLKGTRHRHPTLGLNSDSNATKLVMYTDSDWGHDEDNQWSVTEYVTFLGDSPFSWCSKQQSTVAGSSTEGEYMALSLTGHQGLWLCQLLYDLGLNLFKTPTLILMDNQGALDLSKDNQHHQHTKHIDIMHHFIHNVSKTIHSMLFTSQETRTRLMGSQNHSWRINTRKCLTDWDSFHIEGVC